ncbi:hypothetical protein MKX08_000174 [Trichoderma sp. CBMAI-0020]|nr:hypothetical protein MKX08_000174 [Trichoderma sp. CBMAI-0020]
MGPQAMEKGDIVYVLFGGKMPFCLRPCVGSQYYLLVGECYIHGFMNGESVDMLEGGGFCESVFEVRIRQGFCGSVWGQLEEDGRPSSDRQLISAIFSVSGIIFNIPKSEAFIGKEAPEWADILPQLPPDYTPCNAIISEKIMPVSLPFHRTIVENFILGVDPDEILHNQANKHCLIRPYLGRRRFQAEGERARRLRAYSLRNFPLHMGDMEKIRLKTHDSKVDANNVEFVLAPPRSNVSPIINSSNLQSDVSSHLAIWILDFDCCNDMNLDDSGIEKACRCFWHNNPYYPRPGSSHPSDQKLWESFEDRFLTTSERILMDESSAIKQLPRRLIERIVQTRGVYSRVQW